MDIYRRYIKPTVNMEAIEILNNNQFIIDNKIKIGKAEFNDTAVMDEYASSEGIRELVFRHMSFEIDFPRTDNGNYIRMDIFFEQKRGVLQRYYSFPSIQYYIFNEEEVRFNYYTRADWIDIQQYIHQKDGKIPGNPLEQIIAILMYTKDNI